MIEVDSVRLYGPSTPLLDPSIDYISPAYLKKKVAESKLQDVSLLSEQSSLLSQKPSDDKEIKRKYPGARAMSKESQHSEASGTDIFIPLVGVRKALCIRIVNSFLDGNKIAYTIWIYDVEAGREWYAPMRYIEDFHELRAAALPLCSKLAQIPFPASPGWAGVFGGNKERSESARAAKCRQLEHFIRSLATLIYTRRLHPYISEISIHLQSFLGLGVGMVSGDEQDLQLQAHVTLNEAMCWQMPETGHSDLQMKIRLMLKRAIQRYTFRLFLLDAVQKVVSAFVDQTRANGLRPQDVEALEARGRLPLKERAMKDLERVQGFLDQFQTIVLDGCMNDFESISQRREYAILDGFMQGQKGKVYLEKIVREAVREQIEIEIYAPLRGAVSRLLVHGWRHDDMEIHFKMQVRKCINNLATQLHLINRLLPRSCARGLKISSASRARRLVLLVGDQYPVSSMRVWV